ncbi:MAG: Abi-alpha family protein [Micromonosporaceae bacterium]
MLSDLLGFAARAADVARQVPGVREAEHVVRDVERRAIHEVRGVLDWLEADLPATIDGEQPPAIGARPSESGETGPVHGFATAYPRRGEGLTMAVRLLSQLLDRSLEQTRTEARYLLYVRTLAELVPDEARILAALADGTGYPVIDVVARNAVGQVKGHLIRDVSSVGRAAGVALPLEAHVYVAHLRRLGLVERHPEDPVFNDRYDLLMTEESVRRAQDGKLGRGLTARAIRGTLRISSLGADLWQDCNPPEPPATTEQSLRGGGSDRHRGDPR